MKISKIFLIITFFSGILFNVSSEFYAASDNTKFIVENQTTRSIKFTFNFRGGSSKTLSINPHTSGSTSKVSSIMSLKIQDQSGSGKLPTKNINNQILIQSGIDQIFSVGESNGQFTFDILS